MTKAMRTHYLAAAAALDRAQHAIDRGNKLARAQHMSDVRYHQARLRELQAEGKR